MFGNAERVQGNASMGHKTSNTFRLEGSHPLAFGSPLRFSMAVFQANANLTKYSSFRERQRGVNLALTNISDGESTHEVWYEAAWRTVTLEPGTLVCPPEEAGDSFKSALRHVYSYDTREDPRLPQAGVLLRNTCELAGVRACVCVCVSPFLLLSPPSRM
jgi:outer membrane protein insertion porin family